MKIRAVNFREHQFKTVNFLSKWGPPHSGSTYNYIMTSEKTQPPKGVVHFLHGYGSYVGKFGYIAKMFCDRGFDVVGFDFRGYGHSEGLRGQIEDVNILYNDGYFFSEQVKEFYQKKYQKDIPYILMGYSLGGRVALNTAAKMYENSHKPDAQIQVVPALTVNTRHWTADYWKKIDELSKDPKNTIASPFVATPQNDSYLKPYYNDELQFIGPNYASTLKQLVSITDKEYEKIVKFDHPIYTIVAKQETVLENDPIYKFHQNVKTQSNLKELKEYDCDHFILSDGWFYQECVNSAIDWTESVLKQTKRL